MREIYFWGKIYNLNDLEYSRIFVVDWLQICLQFSITFYIHTIDNVILQLTSSIGGIFPMPPWTWDSLMTVLWPIEWHPRDDMTILILGLGGLLCFCLLSSALAMWKSLEYPLVGGRTEMSHPSWRHPRPASPRPIQGHEWTQLKSVKPGMNPQSHPAAH